MDSSPREVRVFRFERFELEPDIGELRKDGRPIKLHPQPLQLLAFLLENPRTILSREAIKEALWAESTHVDFDLGINSCIRQIRTALGDDADHPRFVQTVPRQGYRFIADVRWKSTGKTFLRRRAALTASLILALVAVSLVVWRFVGTLSRPIESLAVLPLENLSDDSEDEYFADGMTDELIARLSQISALRVISRTSAMQYRNTRKSVPEIARELGVDAVVEGTVVSSPEQIRIRLKLVDASTDRTLWTGGFTKPPGDVFTLQSEISESIAREIAVEVTPGERARLERTTRIDPAAHDAYLRGLYIYLNLRETRAELEEAVSLFDESIALEPSFAPAHAARAIGYNFLSTLYLPPHVGFVEAKASVSRALEIDDGNSDAHAALGQILQLYEWDWPGAERELVRAIELNPNSAEAHRLYARYLNRMGRFEEAIEAGQKLIRLDPMAPHSRLDLAALCCFAGRNDESIALLEAFGQLQPDHPYSQLMLAWNFHQQGRHDDAVNACRRATEIQPFGHMLYLDAQVAVILGAAGHTTEIEPMLQTWLEISKERYVDPYPLAYFYAALKQDEQAIRHLQRAYDERSVSMSFLKTDFFLDSLRSRPKFQALLEKMKFPG